MVCASTTCTSWTYYWSAKSHLRLIHWRHSSYSILNMMALSLSLPNWNQSRWDCLSLTHNTPYGGIHICFLKTLQETQNMKFTWILSSSLWLRVLLYLIYTNTIFPIYTTRQAIKIFPTRFPLGPHACIMFYGHIFSHLQHMYRCTLARLRTRNCYYFLNSA